MSEELIVLLTEVIKRSSTSVVFACLVLLILAVYFAYLINSIISIRHFYTARFMEKAEDVIYAIRGKSEKWFIRYQLENEEDVVCKTCIHPQGNFHGTITFSLIVNTLNRIKLAWHKNGFWRMNQQEFDKYLKTLAIRLRSKNQLDMESMSRGLEKIISETNDLRFSEEDSLKAVTEIFTEGKMLKGKMHKDIIKAIFIFPKIKELI